MTELQKLMQHCIWANQVWVDFLKQTSPSDPYLPKLLAHILLGEQAWFQRISGVDPDKDVWKQKTVEEMQEMLDRHKESYQVLAGQDLARTIEYRRFSGETYRSSVSDILLHLCLHGTHHRGQMAVYASSSGVVVNTDFINFCRLNKL